MFDAIQIREAHFPSRAAIDSYGNGGFRFAEMSHRGSIVAVPSGIYGVAMNGPTPTLENIERIIEEASDIEVFLVGTGKDMLRMPNELRTLLKAKNISTDTMSTGAAVRTFNVLLAEDRAVAALLYAVD